MLAVMLAGAGWVHALPVHAASPPLPPEVTLPPGILLVGTTGGVSDPRGLFTVTVRDFASNPLPNATVSVDFTQCTDARIATSQPYPGVTAQCSGSPGVVSAVTDERGQAHFDIVGAADLVATPAASHCTRIYVDGVLVGTLTVAIYDRDASSGLNVLDVSRALNELLQGQAPARDDFNFSDNVNIVDVSQMLGASLAGGSHESATAFCQ
jgi:hypothetical protein